MNLDPVDTTSKRMELLEKKTGSASSLYRTRCPKKIVPRLCGCYRGALNSIILVFTQLHRSDFNLEFATLYESI